MLDGKGGLCHDAVVAGGDTSFTPTVGDGLLTPTDEHRLLRQTVRDFARKEIEPQAEAHDRSAVLNRALIAKLTYLIAF